MRYPTYILVTMSFTVSAMMSVYFLHSNAEHWKLRYHNLYEQCGSSMVDYEAEEKRYNQPLIESKLDELGCGGDYDTNCQLMGLCGVADYPWVIPGEHNYQTISECINQILEF